MDAIAGYIRSLMENSTPLKPLWNVEQLQGHQNAKWNYIDGCMLQALMELYDITGDQSYFDFVDAFISHYIDESGRIRGYEVAEYNIDNLNEGKVLFRLWARSGQHGYRLAIDHLMEQVHTHPRTQSGNFWHKKIYPHQVWLDGLYMAQPFYAEFETRFHQGQGYSDILGQFRHVFTHLRDPQTHLLYHGWDETKTMDWADPTTGCSPSFWARSLGWYVMALVDTIDALQDPAGKAELGEYLVDVAEALLKYQDPTGLWYQVVDQGTRLGNYLETSGSAMMAYALLKGARLGVLPSTWAARGSQAFQGICDRRLKVDGQRIELEGICLVAGLGGQSGKGTQAHRDGSFAYYVSEPVVKNDAKGVAPFLLAYTETLRQARISERG